MRYAEREVLEYIGDNDVKFIKLFFTDILGTVKSISIMPSELAHVFDSGISFDAASVRGFGHLCASDLFVVPDAGTLGVLPWRPQQGKVVRFFCFVKNPDGTDFAACSRRILSRVVSDALSVGISAKVGTESDFYLFPLDDAGHPTADPQDNGSYLDLAPRDKGENIRREICLTIEQMGLVPETSRHEIGPGQHEIVFGYSDILSAADNLTTFKMAVETVAAKNGLYANFMPKPLENRIGNALHINLSLERNGVNLFTYPHLCDEVKCFVAGVLYRAREITAFLNPVANSYRRIGNPMAPKYICWAPVDRSQLVRIPAASGRYARMELRSPDPMCNHYLALSLVLAAGLEGIREKRPLQDATPFDVYNAPQSRVKDLARLPPTLEEAIALAEDSGFAKTVLGDEVVDSYVHTIRSAETGADL